MGTNTSEVDRLLSIKEVGDAISAGTSKIYTLIRDGELPAVKIGRSTRIRQSDLNALIANAAPAQLRSGGAA